MNIKLLLCFSIFVDKTSYNTVSLQVIELLLVPKPSIEKRNKLLKQIADRFGFNWGPISVIDNASSAYEDPISHVCFTNSNVGLSLQMSL